MRRGIGVAGLQQAARAREQYKNVGDEVKKSNLEAMKEQMATFKTKLEEFALKYKADIRRDPEFRARFHQMCANIGVDPLASNKGIWAKALGFGDFYYQLGVQIVEACWASRAANGGLMELGALVKAVNARRGSSVEAVSTDDVIQAIKKLRALGGGFDVVTIGALKYVRSVPGELNLDKNKVMEVAAAVHTSSTSPGAQGGYVAGFTSEGELRSKLGWDAMRIKAVVQGLLAEGLAMVDDGPAGSKGERLLWFPCLAPPGSAVAQG
uniref:Vacuolar protein sorting-associated protein n=1 Tax=Chlamydomonas leiostraca TaxID=1034604 RepID=A0A7S0RI08_9CHLO|mmetsp:Transcript_23297/g.59550  ORF Transcript_23297/g.59550 Transcript_23297/m.59550 type:complete len:267 (+) Transcript_23297:146-946(+)